MIRKYTPKDKPSLIEIFRQNTPTYFDISEEVDYSNYLEKELEDFFVFEINNTIVGAGGINYSPKEQSAIISWDLIAPSYHGKGIGTQLTQFRIKHIHTKPNVNSIIVRTSQLAYPFYKKMGFKLKTIKKDYWAKGYDLYYMTKKTVSY